MPAKNKMTDLRNHLFETLKALKDDEKPMDLERARVISDLAQFGLQAATDQRFTSVKNMRRSAGIRESRSRVSGSGC